MKRKMPATLAKTPKISMHTPTRWIQLLVAASKADRRPISVVLAHRCGPECPFGRKQNKNALNLEYCGFFNTLHNLLVDTQYSCYKTPFQHGGY
jgi:hypothetical protein